MIDLYAGVGLFAGALAPRTERGRIEAVEANRAAAADARVNLADLPLVKVIGADVRKLAPLRRRPGRRRPVPSRSRRRGRERISATGAGALALVSCDPAAMGRDAGLLARDGWC